MYVREFVLSFGAANVKDTGIVVHNGTTPHVCLQIDLGSAAPTHDACFRVDFGSATKTVMAIVDIVKCTDESF
jgi:hypothetical protein